MNITRWENIFSIIQKSYSIETHFDFYTWLQSEVNALLPHDVLLTCWGNFNDSLLQNNALNYDIASNLSGVSTKIANKNIQEMNVCLLNLHKRWIENNRRWYVVNQLDKVGASGQLQENFPSYFNQLKSLIVYGVTDERSNNECLYVFFSQAPVFSVPDLIMGVIMPHVDNALRKVKHLSRTDAEGVFPSNSNITMLTARELEVIHWIKSGKTNQEIGVILAISTNTVKSHVKRVFQKLNVTKRAQAIALLAQ